MTRLGRTYLVVTVGVGLGALNTGNNLLYLVLGLLLSLIVISGVLSERTLRQLRVERLGADALFAGDAAPFRWRIRTGRYAAFALTVREVGGALQGEAKAAYLPARQERVVRADVTAARRGPLALSSIEVSTTFPLGLFSKSLTFDVPVTLLVYPRRTNTRGLEGSSQQPAQGVRSVEPLPGGEADLLELVELREGEDARRVHWKKSAALGKWVKAERERETEHTFVLRIPLATDVQQNDAACERAAAQAHQLLKQGHAVGLEAGGTRVRPGSGAAQERRLLTALARVGFEHEDAR